MATKGSIALRGRFAPGTNVRLVKVDGPHVMRPGAGDETVDEQTVDKDGLLEFKGVEAGERYFAVGLINGQPAEVRLTGRAQANEKYPDHSLGEMYEAVGPERARLGAGGTGGWSDEPQARGDGDVQTVEGQTWLAQDQVPKGTVQRSDTIRGSAHPISKDERERAIVGWRKQEPVNPVVQPVTPTEEAAAEESRTAELPDRAPAKASAAKSASKSSTSSSKGK